MKVHCRVTRGICVMKAKFFLAVTVIMTILFLSPCLAKEETTPQRDYSFVFTPSYEMELVSINSASLHRLFLDTYSQGIGPQISNKTARYWLGETWSVFWTYMYIIWPHELGHWVRGKQGTGEFIFHNYALPFPHTTVEMPVNATLEDDIVISIADIESAPKERKMDLTNIDRFALFASNLTEENVIFIDDVRLEPN